MSRIRIIKYYGNTMVIPLMSADIKDFNIKEGEEVDIEDLLKNRKSK